MFAKTVNVIECSRLFTGAAILLAVMFVSRQAVAVTLGVSGDSFTLNGSRAFLLGVSYFDADHWHASDLDQLAAHRFNLIRVWVDWDNERGIGMLDADGNLVKKQNLLDLVRAANQRNMVVDVTITQPDAVYGADFSKRLASVRATALALRNEPNVLYDVMNEHDVKSLAGARVSHAQVKQLVDAARQADPDAVVTVSSGGRHILNNMTLVPRNVDAELAAGVDVITPHLTRTHDWYSRTGRRVTRLRDYLRSKGRNIPVYLQEEQRTGWRKSVVTKAQFIEAVEQAVEAGAAGWVLHTEAGFDLAAGTFMSRLDADERAAVGALADAVVTAGGALPSPGSGGSSSVSGAPTQGGVGEHDTEASTPCGRTIKAD